MALEDFQVGEVLSVRWHDQKCSASAVNDFVYRAVNLRNGQTEDVYLSQLKFYLYLSLNFETVISNMVSSATRMEDQSLLRVHKTDSRRTAEVHCHRLPLSEDTNKPLRKVQEGAPEM